MTTKRTFCCCIPTRLGVLLLSPLTFCTAAMASVVCFYALTRHFDSMAVSQRITISILGGILTLVAVTSVAGLVGALLASHRLVSLYASSLYILFFSALVFGVVNFGLAWHYRDDFSRQCRADNPHSSWNDCRNIYTLGYALACAFWFATVFLALYLVKIVRHYAVQLLDEQYHRLAEQGRYV